MFTSLFKAIILFWRVAHEWKAILNKIKWLNVGQTIELITIQVFLNSEISKLNISNINTLLFSMVFFRWKVNFTRQQAYSHIMLEPRFCRITVINQRRIQYLNRWSFWNTRLYKFRGSIGVIDNALESKIGETSSSSNRVSNIRLGWTTIWKMYQSPSLLSRLGLIRKSVSKSLSRKIFLQFKFFSGIKLSAKWWQTAKKQINKN